MSQADLTLATERRRWLRVAEELLIACRGKGHSSDAIYFTRNLSGGGLMFESPGELSPGTPLEIEFYAPRDCEKQTRLFMLIGAQVREIPNAPVEEGSNQYRVGVAFSQIDPQDQACLDEYVNKRLVMASGQRVT
ncbi:MAG: PilZ domain-containing protein [Elusimicrobia bacterium]|nr:PilZ domain-containing protein [Elusimicrobiota bacterium]